MAIIFTLYNHKGGVSKTTTAFNLAHALAEHQGAKVLLVDADPQCNLTELCLTQIIEEIDMREAETGVEQQLPGTTILEALSPRFNGDRPNVDVDTLELIKPDKDWQVFLLRGDISLNEAEDRLSQAHSQRTTSEIHQKRNYVAIHDMLRRLGDKHGFHYIIIDVGPSSGALTRSCFLSCDKFIVPTAPDRFNLQAIRSLSKIIYRWIIEHRMIVRDFRDLGLNVSNGTPEFRGLILQRFQRYGGEPKPAFKLWMKRIPKRAIEELLPSLVEAAGSRDVVFEECWSTPTIIEIPDFASLAPMMLIHGKAVWRLTKDDTKWTGSVWDERSATMEMLRERFFELADKVIK